MQYSLPQKAKMWRDLDFTPKTESGRQKKSQYSKDFVFLSFSEASYALDILSGV